MIVGQALRDQQRELTVYRKRLLLAGLFILLALGLTPGPRVGGVLRQIYEKQLDGSIASLEDGISLAREILADRS